MEELFRNYDTDQDGGISIDELEVKLYLLLFHIHLCACLHFLNPTCVFRVYW